jgi:hypothetical protein
VQKKIDVVIGVRRYITVLKQMRSIVKALTLEEDWGFPKQKGWLQ